MRRILLCVLVLVLASVVVPTVAVPGGPATTQRPISEFLAANQCGWGFSPCCEFGGYICGTDPAADPAREQVYVVLPDVFNLNGLPGTTTSGTVTERPLADGRAEVTVRLRTQHALVLAKKRWADGGDMLLGAGPCGPELCSPPATLAWGNVDLTLAFINPAPGYPLPHVAQLFLCPAEGQQWESQSLVGTAFGPLHAAFGVPEGTPGMLQFAGGVVYEAAAPPPGAVARSHSHAGWCPSANLVRLQRVGSGAGQ